VDPDHAYYQGPGWYRTSFAAQNPFPNGRAIIRARMKQGQAAVSVSAEKLPTTLVAIKA
jgi:beta-galactosidase